MDFAVFFDAFMKGDSAGSAAATGASSGALKSPASEAAAAGGATETGFGTSTALYTGRPGPLSGLYSGIPPPSGLYSGNPLPLAGAGKALPPNGLYSGSPVPPNGFSVSGAKVEEGAPNTAAAGAGSAETAGTTWPETADLLSEEVATAGLKSGGPAAFFSERVVTGGAPKAGRAGPEPAGAAKLAMSIGGGGREKRPVGGAASKELGEDDAANDEDATFLTPPKGLGKAAAVVGMAEGNGV